MKIRLTLLVVCCLFGIQTYSQQVLGNFSAAETFEWPQVVWYRDLANNWDEGLIKMAPNVSGISRSGFGIHLHQSRQFTFWSTGLDPLLSIEGGSGKTYIKGNVGIGTINPQSKLDISGAIKSYNVALGQDDIATSSKNYVNFSSNNHGTVLVSSNLYMSENDNLKIAKSHPSMAGASILIPGNGRENQGGIIFYTNSPATVSENQAFTGKAAMLIKSDGNIGIGTTSPNEKLAVNGNVRAKEVKVEAANWPDYVFDQDYKILGLQDLDRYIKVNKHLPDVPSAAAAEKDGVELGEMNKLLLKKIEELTLHLIDLDKKVKVLEGENKNLKSKNDD